MNSTLVLFTLTCIHLCVTLGLFTSYQDEGTNVIQCCSYLFIVTPLVLLQLKLEHGIISIGIAYV
jgi:hypothetical protein